MASPKAGRSASAVLAGFLDSPEIGRLTEELQATRWTGRPEYPIRCLTDEEFAAQKTKILG